MKKKVSLDKNIKLIFFLKLDFSPASSGLNSSIIGQIIYQNPQTNVKFLYNLQKLMPTDVLNIIESNSYDDIQLCDIPYDFCQLPNSNLLCAHYYKRNLIEYNENLEKINIVYGLNGDDFGPISIALNNRNQLYICDYDSDEVMQTDLEFNKLKHYEDNSDDFTNELCNPKGLFYKNGFVYVCDYGNDRIQILNEDLEFVKTLS